MVIDIENFKLIIKLFFRGLVGGCPFERAIIWLASTSCRGRRGLILALAQIFFITSGFGFRVTTHSRFVQILSGIGFYT